MKEQPKWEIKVYNSQIADTGDYDGHYELTNGDISLITKDDIDIEGEIETGEYHESMPTDAANLVYWLNAIGAKWEDWKLSDALYEKELIEKDYQTLRKIAEVLLKELEWATQCCYEEASSADRAVGIVKDCQNQLNMIP